MRKTKKKKTTSGRKQSFSREEVAFLCAACLISQVEQRFDIASAQLIVPEHLTDRTVDIELDGVKKEMKIYSGLKTGQQVVLIRQQGGQKFLVADRVV